MTTSTYDDDENTNSSYGHHWKEMLLQVFTRILPFLSIMGSSLVAYTIIKYEYFARNPPKFVRPTYSHLMIIISFIDIVFSLMFLLGRAMVPSSSSSPYADGYGTVGTCTFQGLIISLGVGSLALYNSCLMIYFVLAVRYGISERNVTQKYEPVMHLTAIVIAISFTISGLVLQVFNPKLINTGEGTVDLTNPETYYDWVIQGSISNEEMGVLIPFCGINPYPTYCNIQDDMFFTTETSTSTSTSTPRSGVVECQRGSKELVYFFAAILLIGLCLIIMITSLVLLYLKVRRQEIDNTRFHFNGATCTDAAGRTKNNPRRKKKKLSTQVAIQGIYYGVFFTNTFLWLTLGGFLPGDSFVIELIAIGFLSSQGIFNFFIYMKPHWEKFQKERRIKAKQQQQQSMAANNSNSNQNNIEGNVVNNKRKESFFKEFTKSIKNIELDIKDTEEEEEEENRINNEDDDEDDRDMEENSNKHQNIQGSKVNNNNRKESFFKEFKESIKIIELDIKDTEEEEEEEEENQINNEDEDEDDRDMDPRPRKRSASLGLLPLRSKPSGHGRN